MIEKLVIRAIDGKFVIVLPIELSILGKRFDYIGVYKADGEVAVELNITEQNEIVADAAIPVAVHDFEAAEKAIKS